MIQSGILTTTDSTTGQSTGVPVRGAWINFVQNNVTKATVQTNIETGAYSVDVPLGKYTVKIAVGDVTGIQRAGQLFELKAGDKADAFHKWFYGETGSIDDDLLKQFKQISNDINASASRAESAEKGAKQIETNMHNNSIGDANGKYLKEGAYGLGGGNTIITSGNAFDIFKNGFYRQQDASIYPTSTFSNMIIHGYSLNRMSGLLQSPISNSAWLFNSNTKTFNEIYSSYNTIKDKNNVLHATAGTPKDTLLVGDYGLGDTVLSMPHDMNKFDANPTGFYYQINGISGAFFMDIRSNKVGIPAFRLSNDPYTYKFYLNPAINGQTNNLNAKALIYHDKNTTVDSNGFIKKASPIVKLFDDHIEWNQDFKEEPVFEKLDIGVYKISNTNGLARGITHGDWYIETPKNRNGLPYFMVEWEQDAITDDVTIKVFDRKFDINIGDFINGEPRDIGKDERWIDLRFHEQIYSLTNELPDINIPYRELWGIEPYIPPIVEPIEEDIALEDQRAF